MQKKKYINIPYTKRILFFWIVGFILGSTLGVFFLPQYKEQFVYIQKQLYTSVSGVGKYNVSYFLFCMYDGIKQMVLIVLVAFTMFFSIYGKLLFAWNGVVMGVLFAAAIKCYGAMGWLLFCVNWFPQGIIYAFVYIVEFSLCHSIREENFSKQIKKKGNYIQWGLFFFLCLIGILIGGYLESSVNLDLLKRVLEKCMKQE